MPVRGGWPRGSRAGESGGEWDQLFRELLKAREKNLLEEHRLSESLRQLERQRSARDKNSFNEIYEQKRLVFRYGYEVHQMRKRNELREQMKSLQRSRTSSIRKRASTVVPPPEADLATESLAGISSVIAPDLDRIHSDTSIGQGNYDVIRHKPSNLANEQVTIEEEKSHVDVVNGFGVNGDCSFHQRNSTALDSSTTGGNSVQFSVPVPEEEEVPPSSSLQQFSSILETVPRKSQQLLGTRTDPGMSSRALPGISERRTHTSPGRLVSQSAEDFTALSRQHTDIVLRDYWVGDPKAIGSVRRPRLPVEEMSSRNKTSGDVRKYIRDMPRYPSCSKNCNRPSAHLESIVHTTTILPIINKGKLLAAFKKQEKARELLEQETVRVDIEVLARVKKGRLETKSLKGLQQEAINKLNTAINSSLMMPGDTVTMDVNKNMRVQMGYKYRPNIRIHNTLIDVDGDSS